MFYFHSCDPFASIHLRNVHTSYPHPFQTIHLAAVGTFINISLYISCMIIVLRRKPLHQHEFTKEAIMRVFVANTYQFWCSLTTCFTCLAGVIHWRDVFRTTLRRLLSCTSKHNCSIKENIVSPWEAIIELNWEWENCLSIQDFHNFPVRSKFATIMNSFEERGHSLSNCIEAKYQLNAINALSNYILNCSLCIIGNIMHMIYLGVMYTNKRNKIRPDATSTSQRSMDTDVAGDIVDLGNIKTLPRSENDKELTQQEHSLRQSIRFSIGPRNVKEVPTKLTSTESESSFFQQIHEDSKTNATSDLESGRDANIGKKK